jgi:hypothetical protein
MLWRKCCYTSVLRPLTGVLLAILVMETVHEFAGPLLPSLFAPLTAEAATGYIDPDGNGTVAGTLTGCSTNYDCINDGTRSPTTPNTSDYVQFSRNQVSNYTMGTLPYVSSVSSVTVYLYHVEGTNQYQFQVGLFAANETTQYGSTQNVTISTSNTWTSVTISGLSLTQSQLDGLRVRLTCTRPGTGNSYCRAYSMYADVTYTETNNANVSTQGSQQDVQKGVTNQFIGGSFAVTAVSGSANVTSVTINETGSVNASSDLKNIKLYYESDTTNPYDCSGMTYDGTEAQYGSTDSDGFSGANGSSVFTGSVGISLTSALCLYVVLDVQSSAGVGDVIEVEISNPSTDVAGSGSLSVTPATAVAISGQSTITQAVPTQTAYHWRNDNNDEANATSATGGSQDTVYNDFPKSTTKRLRMQVSNEGNTTSASHQYRLEYVSKTGYSQCADVPSGWTDVGAASGDFDMSNSSNLTDGNNTTDVSSGANGGISNPSGKTFLTTNAAVKDTSSQTSGITLTSSQFVEIEYSIISSSGVSDGSTYCFRVTNAGTALLDYNIYPELTIAADINASASGAHASSALIPSVNNYQGGYFAISDTGGGSNTLTGITLTEIGTVTASSGLSNVKLRYDLDTSNPYTCDDVSYSGSESLFGSATTFNNSNKAVFTGSLTVSTTQTVCLYVEYDVTASSTNGQTVEIEISNPSSDVVVTSSSVAPASAIGPTASTTLQKPVVAQSGYHWRNNDNNEASASSATGGSENTTYSNLSRNSIVRLRLSLRNTGLTSAAEARYRIEWAQKISTCSAVASWTRVDTASDAWEMGPTGNLTQGSDTTNVAVSGGGVTDLGGGTFLSNNNGVADDNDLTASSTLPANNYLDLEYSLRATNSAVQGATYCFRVTANGTALDTYTNYAEATIKVNDDFKIQRGFVDATSTQVVIFAGTHYEAPASASSSFIRITNTHLTGAGPTGGAGNANADDVTIYITNQNNILNNIIFQRASFPAGDTRIYWEIVEYTGVAGGENEIIVRSSDVVTYSSGNTTQSGPTINNVTDESALVPFITSQYNPDTGRNSYHLGLATSQWNTTNNQVDLVRGASGNAAIVTYSLVEFTGANWNIQRASHTYSAASTTQTQSISAVNSLSRTFIHSQKRTAQNNHADIGHEVWLSGIGQVSFKIDNDASTPANHTSVVFVIENTQTEGKIMDVHRSSGGLTSGSGGTGPVTYSVPIGATLDDLAVSSIFTNNRSNGTTRSWPEPMLGVRISSTTHYHLWRSDTASNIVYRTEVIEWPTAERKLQQGHFAIYENGGGLTPTTTWSGLGEDAPMTADDDPMAPNETVRIRMTIAVSAATMPAGLDAFRLSYGKRVTTCSAISEWHPVGEIGSTTAPWRGYNNSAVSDGAVLSTNPPTGGDLLISVATIAGTYEEQNNSATNPYVAVPGDEVEFDWVVQHNNADDKSSYCFRMEEADGTLLNNGYSSNYPVLRTVGFEPLVTNWRWYDDETNITPTSALGLENIAPSNIANQNALKLRVVLKESSGAAGLNNKFVLQYSEYSDFSQKTYTLTSTTTCDGNSLWCYYDGGGVNNVAIPSTVISNADTCGAGGCGTHNEATSTVGATFDQPAYAATEYEFTLKHDGARVNRVYYFRLYDIVTNEAVGVADTYSYPSVMTEGAALAFTVAGVNAGTTIGDIVTDATTTASAINFGSLPFGVSREAAQELTVDTNATEGYQLLQSADGQMRNTYNDEIPPITGTNATPLSWGSACSGLATGCFGYHTTDATLSNGSSRFAPVDSYAAVDTTQREIMYSSIPTSNVERVVYRSLVTEMQEAGEYAADLVYVVVPVH